MSLVEISGADAVVASMRGRVPLPPPPPPMRRREPPPPMRSRVPPPPPPMGRRVLPRPLICPGAPPPPPPPLPMFGALRAKVDPKEAEIVCSILPRPAKKKSPLKRLHWVKITRALPGSLWDELQRRQQACRDIEDEQIFCATELDVSEIETLFSLGAKPKPQKVPLIDDLRRAHGTEIRLMLLNIRLPDMMAAIMAMDESVLDVDEIRNLINLFPTKEDIELLKTYTGDKGTVRKREQYFQELMKVPQVESKLRVFSFKIQFATKITEFKNRLSVVDSACEEVRSSQKLKEIMKKIPSLGNTSNQGVAVGYKLDSLSVKRMHYFCKVIASEASDLLDVHKDLESLESASMIQLESLAEEMQDIIEGLEKLNQELTASETDGPVSQVFSKTLKDFISIAETQVATVLSLYSVVGKNADALAIYFGEDPNRCPFEQVTTTLFDFIRLFKKAHEENVKKADLEKRKAANAKMEHVKGVTLTRKVVHNSLIDLRRAFNIEIMLRKVTMPLPDIMAALLAMDESVLDVDQIENIIRFCPTKEEMELLESYTGDKATLGKCDQYFLELMKVPGVESKLRVFSFKIQFGTKITELNKGLNAVNSACEEVRTSEKLKEILKIILCLGNIMNQGTAKGSAVGFKLDSLLILSDTRAANSEMTLMHYLCKVLASKASDLLDFHKDLESLESASKIHLKLLAEEMVAITKGLEKLNHELTASESDGPVSQVFRKLLKDFISMAETQVATVPSLYSTVGRNADALANYFGESPNDYPFEKVTATLLSFIRLFKKAHEENVKQAELEKTKERVSLAKKKDAELKKKKAALYD
ncbi:Formin FH2 domain [Arabidopsis suecica]|uniref:Formin-like protein n=1 Tax=Arabidopsis suecica TaxID=45249 RepID=A0A8T2BTM5_ARASU|nr:Formin FH2 domain [Arabidopsis suecica]